MFVSFRLWRNGPGFKVKNTTRYPVIFSEWQDGHGRYLGRFYVRYFPRGRRG